MCHCYSLFMNVQLDYDDEANTDNWGIAGKVVTDLRNEAK